MTTTDSTTTPARAPGTVPALVGCDFFFTVRSDRGHRYPTCGKPSAWKWTTKRGTVAHYCQEHGDGMRNEGRCADSGKWERLTANNVSGTTVP